MSTKAERVVSHYDVFIKEYLYTYGMVIQSARSYAIDALLKHEFESAHIEKGMRLLDAGCGFAGPAVYFAEREPTLHIEAVTLSSMQQTVASQVVADCRLSDRITVRCGDYHHLSTLYPSTRFDRAIFLESLCHAANVKRVLQETFNVCAGIYIKDYFRIDMRTDPEKHRIQEMFYDRMEAEYHVRFPYVQDVLQILESIGFRVVFARPLPADLQTDYDTAVEFEQRAGLTWREGLPFVTSESWEIFAVTT